MELKQVNLILMLANICYKVVGNIVVSLMVEENHHQIMIITIIIMMKQQLMVVNFIKVLRASIQAFEK